MKRVCYTIAALTLIPLLVCAFFLIAEHADWAKIGCLIGASAQLPILCIRDE